MSISASLFFSIWGRIAKRRKVINRPDQLKGQTNIADFICFAVPGQRFFAIFLEEQKPILAREGLARFEMADDLLLFLFRVIVISFSMLSRIMSR